MKRQIIVIVGPTGAGKSALGVFLAKKFGGEIVSADSRQIYKELSIGTAKPRGQWQVVAGVHRYVSEGVIHHLIDEKDPKEEFVLTDFLHMAHKTIEDIVSRSKLPIIVGGTAQYIYALLENWQIPEVPPNLALRKRLEKLSAAELDKMLREIDADEADIASMNPRRLSRSLEIYEATQKKPSEQKTKGESKYKALKLGIPVPDDYVEMVKKRVKLMFEEGLQNEVNKLLKHYSWDLPALQTIGYQEFREGGSVEERVVQATLRFSKRQMTWFKRDKGINWVSSKEEAENLVNIYMI